MFGRPPTAVDSSGRSISETPAAKKLASATSAELIPHIRALSETLQSATETQLIAEVGEVRKELARGHLTSDPHMLVAGLSLACDALRRTRNIRLYDV